MIFASDIFDYNAEQTTHYRVEHHNAFERLLANAVLRQVRHAIMRPDRLHYNVKHYDTKRFTP